MLINRARQLTSLPTSCWARSRALSPRCRAQGAGDCIAYDGRSIEDGFRAVPDLDLTPANGQLISAGASASAGRIWSRP